MISKKIGKSGKPKSEEAAETSSGPDISGLLEQIDFSVDNVVQAAAGNPGLFLKAINFRCYWLRRRNATKMAWEKIQAETDMAIRRHARENGIKITEGDIDAQVLLEDTVAAAATQFSLADEMDEYSKLIVEAFRMRRDCLRIVGDLTRDELSIANAIEVGNEKLTNMRKRLQERFPGQ